MYDSLALSAETEPTDLRGALEAAHEAAWPWALSCCRGDRETALECLQSSYLAILEGRARFEGRSSLRTFLFGVIRMTARAARRRAFARSLLFAPESAGRHIAAPGDQDRSALRGQVERALDALSPRQADIAALVLLHGFTLAEAAEVLKISPGAANRHYARAKTALRARLAPETDHD